MREPTKEELREFLKFDGKIYSKVKDLNEDNFKELWVSEREYEKHIKKRLKEDVIKNERDYIDKIKNCVINPDEIYVKKYKEEIKEKFNRWDRVYYKKSDMWVAIFNEKSKISTAYYIMKDFNEILLKGEKNQFEIIIINIEELKNERKN